MSEFAAENLIETGSIPEGKASIEEAIADMGKAATLAEWVYAGLRIETRDWSAELRKSSDVQLPKFALLEKSVEQTGSVMTEAVEMKTALQKPIGASVGLSLVSENNVDQALQGNREAKVMGFEDFRLKVSQDVGFSLKAVSESFKSIPPSHGKTDLPTSPTITTLPDVAVEDVTPENDEKPEVLVVVIETPAVAETLVVEEVVVEVVAPDVTLVAEPETAVVAVIETLAVAETLVVEEVVAKPVVDVETPVIEEPATEAVAPDVTLVAEPEIPVVAVIETPASAETPAVEEVAAEIVAPEVVAVAEAETPVVSVVELVSTEQVAAKPVVVVETPVIEEPTTVAVAPEDNVVAEAETLVVLGIETSAVAVVELPQVEEFSSEPVAQETVAQEAIALAETEAAVVVGAVETTAAEMPSVDEVAAEFVAPEVVVVAEAEIPALAVVELPVIDEIAAEPAMIEPIVAVVPETPAVEPIPGVKTDLDFGRLYFHDFDSSRAKIVIRSDYVTNFDDLLAQSNLYQDEASTVLELANGSDFIILTQFSVGDVSADMFVFEAASLRGDTAQVSVRENEVVTEDTVAGDLFTFGLNSGRIYVTDFDMSSDKIFIKADLFSSFDEMISRTAVYQDGSAAVFELHDSADMMILPHFSIKNLREDMFVFEAETASKVGPYPDTQFGTDQNDILIFGAGDQMIDPGLGFDVVTGGEGNDTFIFGANSGHDFIVDFKTGEDHIKINSDLAQGFDDFTEKAAIYQDGGATQIEFSGGQLITLFDTNAKAVSAEWFSFG